MPHISTPKSLAELIYSAQHGGQPYPTGPTIQPEMSTLAWLGQQIEKVLPDRGDPVGALAMGMGPLGPKAAPVGDAATEAVSPAKQFAKAVLEAARTRGQSLEPAVASHAPTTVQDLAQLSAAKKADAIKAYHGSPHDFDQFSLSKIGTGEGAQAYGHGLYFAENPGVAESYKKAGVTGDLLTVRVGKDVLRDTQIDDVGLEAIKYLESGAKDAGQFPHNTAYYAKKRVNDLLPNADAIKARIDAWKDAKIGYEPVKGQTYEVNIDAHPDDFLDWDKPLSQQSEKIKAATKKFNLPTDQPVGAALQRAFNNPMFAGDIVGKNTATSDEVRQALNAAGIKGIRYADAGSRSKNLVDDQLTKLVEKHGSVEKAVDELGKSVYLPDAQKAKWRADMIKGYKPPTSNYVVFDDQIIAIAKKYGVALPIAAEMLRQAQTPTASHKSGG